MIPSNAIIHLATQPVDMRKSFDGLAGLVRDKLGRDPRAGSLFIFYNARKNRLKVLFYDATGYCLLYKRFDRGVFHLPVVIDPLARELEVSAQEMAAMLRGLDVPADRPRRVRKSIKKEQPTH